MIKILEALTSNLSNVSELGQPVAGKINDIDSNRSFSDIIKKASEKYGVDQNVIKAVIKQESSFDPNAVSSCGAQGLMQLMPSTAKSLGVNNPFNAEENVMAGTHYLKQKLDEFNGDLHLALAAYNAGSGAVHKYGGVPPYKETRAYVDRIIKSVNYLA
ncbi:MAG TPA: lytic transglycosylase domain-containing protein [Syntrophomonadaceae bacterium]|nr:lytic transglycosylase domain-containing protein [Syntrophomonadaceae bacterium]